MTQKKKVKKGDSDSGVDLLDKQKSKNKVVPPRKFKIVYLNDDFTPMELVTISLIQFFHYSAPAAMAIMMSVHEKGRGIAKGGLTKEIAETKVERVVQFFRSQGYPFLAQIEPEE